MARSRFMISAVLLIFQVQVSLQNCRIIQAERNLQNYWCNTIQELEQEKNFQLLDVNIYSGKTLPVLSNQTHTRTPNLQVVLTDEFADGLSPNTFKILKDISKQVSKNSQLTTLPKGLFESLPLQKLYLNDNGIQSIQVGAFSNMQQLEELHITRNNLRSVEAGIFNSLPVDTLSLANNKISVIRRNALFNMKNLRHLYLNGNSLSEFRPDLFISYGSNLKTLWLQNNYLSEFDRNCVKSLDNLKVLNLANNRISKIIIYAFENLLNLMDLNLSSNQLQDLDEEIFAIDGMTSLTKFQINDNSLSFLTPKLLGRLSSLKYIRIGGNPWICPCFDAILSWLAEHNIQQFCDFDYYTGSRPVCVAPKVRTSTCDYSASKNQFIQEYADLNVHSNNICTI